MTHKEKLLQYIENKGITKTKFTRICGFSNGYLDSKGSITSDKLGTILENFSDLNIYWLLMDKGEMIITPESNQKTTEQISNELSMLGMDSKITKLQKEFETFKDAFFKVIEEKLDEAIKNREI
ncbi:conserved protein of unknown function [Tenacibaculum sp. 190130A14a]|uniref:HTH cro/C1-type domain-containing protein n=1 Tax=Tenacibaculum polynesiense TaxID=3137857 RepID=A0ABM9P789_9FLAO